jgi:phosphotransferase system enzyme I (PtsI)
MSTSERHKNRSTENQEDKWTGIGVSKGVAVGRVVLLHGENRQFYHYYLDENQVDREIRRFRAAIRLSRRQLKKIKAQAEQEVGAKQAFIFEAHLLMLEDSSLLSQVENLIREEKVNAEWAVKTISDKYLAAYSQIENDYLQQRQADFHDVIQRLLVALSGGSKNSPLLPTDSVIIAEEVLPSTVVELSRQKIQAIITEHGGWTSHAFILAREFGLPAVTGIKGISRQARNGDKVIIDGYNGQVLLRPTQESLKRYQLAVSQFQIAKNGFEAEVSDKLKTIDGKVINIRANIEIPAKYPNAKQLGANGIGLFRSEFLLKKNRTIPSEKEQIAIYREIGQSVGEDGAKIRLFDFHLEQVNTNIQVVKERNPALGLRAIRLGLSNEEILRTQIRAILQAAKGNKLDIVVPMVSDLDEIIKVKQIIDLESNQLKSDRKQIGTVGLGAMIEVPSAVWMAEELAQECDFFCIGTNDLVQYLLAVDRDNENVADWFRTLHPAVLRCLRQVFMTAEKAGKPAIVCGEMASSPLYSLILVGLGANELSLNVPSIPRVRRILSRIRFDEAYEVVSKLEICKTALEIEENVRSIFSVKWGNLFPPEFLPLKKN